ncbi:VCBS domain-containing protein [Bradyrhizobium sp. 170]|uniref:VCBS domain-containing protein n=1 Tax=Bradyrhizobium sp. 170 TaxID=2782641 RepID=UPI0020001F74|nr:VCBS domain-containing protein [Bradyrhizobium sp. 170]UPK06248.1 VCBS domain-containing protein [Bradyrhizobium sp. 170]
MATQTTDGGSTTSFSNTPQAKDDIFTSGVTAAGVSISLTEDNLQPVVFDVMGNDLGGNAKTLFSIDNGINNSGAMSGYSAADLLTQDTARAEVTSTDTSVKGAKIWITADGKVGYDASTLSAQIAALSAGEFFTDSFIYAIRLGNGTLSWATATVRIAGVNDGPVAVADTNAVKEDSAPTAVSGNVLTNDTDVDTHDTHSVTAVNGSAAKVGADVAGTYGTLHLNSDGTYIYTLYNGQANVQALAAGQQVYDTFSYTNSDNHGGSSAGNLTITVTGTNDIAVISGVATGGVTEDVGVVAGNLATSGALSIADADQGQANFTAQAGTAGSNGYGSFTLDAAGNWSYSADDSQTAVQQLGAGQSITDSFTAVSSDGSASQLVTVTITGTNDIAVISGVATGGVTEDVGVVAGNLATSGALSIADADQGQANFTAQAGTAGSNGYGSFTLDAAGNWSYSADDSQTAVQQLGAGQSITDSFTAVSSDGSASQLVTVTITGTNDIAVISGVATGGVTEDVGVVAGNLATSGALSIADADQGQANFTAQAGTAGSNGYGSFTLDAAGNWSYSADDSQTAIQQLGAGQSITDSFTAVSSDGSASQLVTVTITGTNDIAVISGVATGGVTEDVGVVAGNLATSGALSIADADQGQANFTAQAGTAGSNGYGSFTLDAAGNWSYSADDSQTAIQQLGAGQSITDSFTAVSSDGSASQLVTVTITGTNDIAVISGVATGGVTEDVGVVAGNLATSGALSIADADQGQANFTAQAGTAGSNGYGSFTLDAAGNWSYSADDSQTAIQQLGAGQSITDSFTAVSSDGSASQLVTVTITGTNDIAVISGVATGGVTEDVGVVAGNLATSGALSIADADQGQANFTAQAGTAGSNGYGSFTLDAAGNWSYSADDSQTAVQQLGAGQSITDSFTAVSSDGSASQLVTVTITGTNDIAVISGVATGGVTEDVGVVAGNLATSGALSIADADQGQANFTAQAGTAGSNGYGSFTLDAAGNWSYSADDSQTAIQQLGAGQSITDSFTAVSSDGSASQLVTVTITGTNDIAVISGVATGGVTEDVGVVAGNLATSGALSIADADQGQANFTAQAGTAGSNGYGSFTLDAAGNWSYSADDSQTAIQQLGAGQSITDSFTAVSSDGSASQLVTVTITGTNDIAVISGVATGGVTEDVGVVAGNLATSGALSIADADQGQANFTAQAGTAGSNGYGSFTLDAAGNWSYSADDSQTAIQQLGAGQSITDSFTAVSSDGSASQLVTVTITGTNDIAVISGVATGGVTEDVGVVAGNLATSGALSIADADQGQANFTAQAGTAGSNGYGSFTLDAAGNWSYSADDSQTAIQQLGAGQSITDSFTAVSSDGSASQLVTVTITGTNDIAVISGVATGGVTEDVGVVAGNLATSGALSIADADQGQANFTAQAGTAGSNGYGSFTLDAAGNWSYSADDSQTAIQQLGAGQSITDSFTAVSSDGSASQLVTVTITGTNDIAVISGVATGGVTEDVGVVAGNLATSGALSIADADQGQANFTAQAGTAGSNGYGSFTLDAAGNWSYSADDSQTAIQQLGAGQSITDSFTAVSSDGSASQLVTVTITGTNDIAVISGVATGGVTEDVGVVAGNLATSGALSIADADQGQANFTAQAGTAGSNGYGSFTLDAAGNWSYSADDSQTAIQQLGAGQSITDSFTAVSSDGSASQLVTVTITGTNDIAVISGVATGGVTEDVDVVAGNISTSGALSIADADQGQANFTAQAGTAGSNGYGSFTLDAAGNWSYSADDSQTAVQQLGAGQSITDSFTAVSSDGSASQLVTVTITGTNDIPVAVNDSTSVNEDATTANLRSLLLSNDTDPDSGETATLKITGVTQGAKGTVVLSDSGTAFNFSDDVLTYSADGNVLDALAVGQSTTDTFTYTITDAQGATNTATATVTITGTNDTPVAVNDSTSVNEDATTANLRSLLLSNDTDPDSGETATLKITGVTQGAKGTVVLNNNGTPFDFSDDTVTYTADGNVLDALAVGQSTTDSFTYTVTDAQGATNTATVMVTINGVNDAANDLIFSYTGASGNSLPSGAFGQISVVDPDGGAQPYSFSATGLSATTLAGGVATNFAGDLTVSSSGVISASNLDDNRVYELSVQVTQGTSTFTETFSVITGTNASDTVTGSAAVGDDVIFAQGAGDIILAGSGDDTVFGQSNDDQIHGGAGNDTLYGANGNDSFFFDTALDQTTNVDTIKDFNANSADQIHLENSIFTALSATGVLNATNFNASAGGNAADGNDFVLYDTSNGNLYYDADGNGSGNKVLVAKIDPTGVSGTVNAADFLII